MFHKLLVLVLLATTVCVNSKPFDGVSFDNPGEIHAVLLSTVPCDYRCYLNYVADSEIAQTYHLLRDNGVPAENIILFMNGGIANNADVNQFLDTLYTDMNKSRNYNEDLKVDYSGDEVTVNNYLAVLSGNKDKVQGGSGRVLSSTATNRVFVSHEGHGGDGVLDIAGNELLSTKELNEALKEAQKKKLFKELTYYIMACHSGSMFAGQLKTNGNIYGLTAAKPNLDTMAYQFLTETKDGKKFVIYINTQFGRAWLSDSEVNDTSKQTLEEQFKIVYPQVASHPSQYGNLNIAKEPLANFEGPNGKKSQMKVESSYKKDSNTGVPVAPIASYLLLQQKLQNTNSFEEQQKLTQQLKEMEKERAGINQKVDAIVNSFVVDGNRKFASLKRVIQKSPQMITQLDCHHVVVKTISRECKPIIKSPFVNDFITPMINLCEQKFDAQRIIAQIQKQCAN